MELKQEQTQQLSQQQLQSLHLLQLSAVELDAFVQDLALGNPMVDINEAPPPHAAPDQTDELLQRLRWLDENDIQNAPCRGLAAEPTDPLATVGTAGGLEESLQRTLLWQLDKLAPDRETLAAARYLAACLDDDGYLRVPVEELAQASGIPAPQLERGLAALRTLDPPGVGAASLSECLCLQLERLGETGPALAIARGHLEQLARRQYRAIAGQLGVGVEEVRAADELIRRLDPRPGAAFASAAAPQFILPDVFVEEVNGVLTVRTRRDGAPVFRINKYYRSLLSQSEDPEVRAYLSAKLHQAENVLFAVEQRESTLLRCARFLTVRQELFFRAGPQALAPLSMTEAAEELAVHVSTISRTARKKYLQCAWGVFPLQYFFQHSAVAGDDGGGQHSAEAARALLRRLIEGEDPAAPLSDQKLCEQMAREGCPISRRTVAKYREELRLPSAARRKRR